MRYRFLILLSLILLPMIAAESSFYIPQDQNYSIKFTCEIDNAICSATATCNASIDYPNSSSLISNEQTTLIGNSRYNLSLNSNQTSLAGDGYTLALLCFDGNLNGTTTINFGINPSGISPTQQRTDTITRSVYFIFVISLILFIAFLFTKQSTPVKWTYFAISILFFLIGINIIFIGLEDEIVNPKLSTFFLTFTAISWYFYWFIAGLLIIMWILTFLQTFFYNQNMNNLRRYD